MKRSVLQQSHRLTWASSCVSRPVLAPRVAMCCARGFASKPVFQAEDLAALKVNGGRMMETLHATCEFGKAHPYGRLGPTETGMARLTLNDDDKKVREWLIREVEALGCKVTIDKIGNMFAVRPGQKNDLAPILMGSHLDTQPTGGRYDGILGIMAALEVLKTLKENDVQTVRPIGLVNWTNEEGARFPKTTMGSSVWSGDLPLEEAWSMKEVASLAKDPNNLRTVKQELERIGFLGDVEASYQAQPIAAHFELHIEQGPILENEGLKIGVVEGGQAYNWFEVEVKGMDSHAGTTPLRMRSDPMAAAARMITAARRLAIKYRGLATVGIIQALPGSINTIPHTVKFTLDIRHPSRMELKKLFMETREKFEHIANTDGRFVDVKFHTLTLTKNARFAKGIINSVKESAEATLSVATPPGGKPLWKRMISGAGHDSCAVQRRSPAGMIFTPTRNGASHCPDEYCGPGDCAIGAQVLLGAVLRYELRDRENPTPEMERGYMLGVQESPDEADGSED